MDRPVTAPYTAAELAAILATYERGGGYVGPPAVGEMLDAVPRLVAELTRAREALRMLVVAMDRFNRTGLPIQALEAARAALEEQADGDTER